MIRRLSLWAALALAVAGCGRHSRGNAAHADSTLALGGSAPASLVRLARDGGPARLYDASLEAGAWKSTGNLPAVVAVVGADDDGRAVYLIDRKRNVVALDLESGRSRTVLPQVTRATLGPDGSLYAVDTGRTVTRVLRRTPRRYRDRLGATPTALYATMGGDLLARGRGAGLEVMGPDHPRQHVDLPAGPSDATYWGDLLAVGTDTAVVLYASDGKRQFRSLDVDGAAGPVLFSPSGHRVYVAERDGPTLRIVDRFGGGVLGTVALPGRAAALRGDRLGDWLLVRAAGGDSIWVVDLVRQRLVGTAAGRWDDELPAVVGRRTLVLRRGGDVVALDLSRAGFPAVGTVKDGAKDAWAPVAWAPPSPATLAAKDSARTEAGAEAADSSADAVDAAPDTVTGARTSAPAQRVYLQISSSQNPEWARDLSQQLGRAGVEATVLEPRVAGDPYRVVVGPYESREAAEEASRKLGRPSFIIPADSAAPAAGQR